MLIRIVRGRVHIRSDRNVLKSCTSAESKESTHLCSRRRKIRVVLDSGRNQRLVIFGKRRILRAYYRGEFLGGPASYRHSRYCVMSKDIEVEQIRVRRLARPFTVRGTNHFLLNCIDGIGGKMVA